MKIGKYIFDSREQAQTKIDALGTAQDENGTNIQLTNILLYN